jgi:hypothetical protein
MPSTSTPGPGHRLFVVVVAGTADLKPEHYPWVVAALERLLGRQLPQVKILHGSPTDNGTARLVQRYARERALLSWQMAPGALDMLSRAGMDGAIVFDAGGEEEADLARRVRAKGLQVRTVGVGWLLAAG